MFEQSKVNLLMGNDYLKKTGCHIILLYI